MKDSKGGEDSHHGNQASSLATPILYHNSGFSARGIKQKDDQKIIGHLVHDYVVFCDYAGFAHEIVKLYWMVPALRP